MKARLRFGPFEVDRALVQLRKDGEPVRLQEQPFRLLVLLAERSGEVVTRDEIREKLWSADTYVEFEHSLNTAVNRLRTALGDSASEPEYIETVPRRGYRFIGKLVDPRRQWSSLGVGDDELGSAGKTPSPASTESRLWKQSSWRERLAWGVAGILALALVTLPNWHAVPERERVVRRWSFVPKGLDAKVSSSAISPNGKHIAYRATTDGTAAIWIRDIDDTTPRRLAGTEGAMFGLFWSPDSEWIGFAVGPRQSEITLKKIRVSGSGVVSLSTHRGGWAGGSFSPDGATIALTSSGQVHGVPSGGGEPKTLFERIDVAGSRNNIYPSWLPVGAPSPGLLVTVGSASPFTVVLKLLGSSDIDVITRGSVAVYSPSGHLVFGRLDRAPPSLWALKYDLTALEPQGEPFQIAANGVGPTLSTDGTLAYVDRGADMRRLVWRDRDGSLLGHLGRPAASMTSPNISPDDRHIAVQALVSQRWDIWVHDAERSVRHPVTFGDRAGRMADWSPDGDSVVYDGLVDGRSGIWEKAANGTGKPRLLVQPSGSTMNYGWSPDGRYLFFSEYNNANWDLSYVAAGTPEDGPHVVRFLDSPFDELFAQVSPNGRWVAFASEKSGQFEVYVRPFPEGDDQWQVSSGGGTSPRWSKAGDELFYVQGDSLVSVRVSTSPTFSPGEQIELFSDPALADRPDRFVFTYDVSADGRFLLVEDAPDADGTVPPSIQVVENWYEEFRAQEE